MKPLMSTWGEVIAKGADEPASKSVRYQVWLERNTGNYRERLGAFKTENEAQAFKEGYEVAAMSFGGVEFKDHEWFAGSDRKAFRLFVHEEQIDDQTS